MYGITHNYIILNNNNLDETYMFNFVLRVKPE